MKKLILLALTAVIMAGCDEKQADGTYISFCNKRVYVIDSCDYIGLLDQGDGNFLAHKGNCRFCAERRKQEMKELVEQLINNYGKY